MHDSVGTPSIWTVHAPQWPSLHAIFVPVRPSCSRSSCARLMPTGASSSYDRSLTVSVSSGTRGHRHDVGEMDEARRRAGDDARFGLVLCLGERAPEIACRHEQLMDLVELRFVPVALVARIQGKTQRAEGILLADEQ